MSGAAATKPDHTLRIGRAAIQQAGNSSSGDRSGEQKRQAFPIRKDCQFAGPKSGYESSAAQTHSERNERPRFGLGIRWQPVEPVDPERN